MLEWKRWLYWSTNSSSLSKINCIIVSRKHSEEFLLHCSVPAFNNRWFFFVLCGIQFYPIFMQEILHNSIEKFRPFICPKHLWVSFRKYRSESISYWLPSLVFQGANPPELWENIDHHQEIFDSLVPLWKFSHLDQISRPNVVNSIWNNSPLWELPPDWLV